ncbi:hypothetical protein AKI39_08965 [Bordetella sp. H567]|uniref:hypothetical protein n=1 Tax=Bordetella sp. H567 TaxID=1697043 RepID=UPI00081C5D12|nr:hypothetical protein [Bordetella sp. H567]AOB30797.1 hypothetical protein AKI39_08965 [Bordetella sp. H567]
MKRADVMLAAAIGGLAPIAWHPSCTAHALPAVVSASVTPPALPPGGGYTPLGESMRVQGLPVFVWLLDAPGSLRDIASWLSARQPALRDLWVRPGAIVLAGIAEGMHWAARLSDAGAGRTQGTISAMPVDVDAAYGSRIGTLAAGAAGGGVGAAGAGRGSANPGPLADPAWRLPGGQLHFEFRSRDEAASIVEQIWTHAVSPADLRKQLVRELLAAGWRPADSGAPGPGASAIAGAAAPPAAQSWSLGRRTLSLIIVPLDRGSGITAVTRIGA